VRQSQISNNIRRHNKVTIIIFVLFFLEKIAYLFQEIVGKALQLNVNVFPSVVCVN